MLVTYMSLIRLEINTAYNDNPSLKWSFNISKMTVDFFPGFTVNYVIYVCFKLLSTVILN
jgi:hypothetical protein